MSKGTHPLHTSAILLVVLHKAQPLRDDSFHLAT